MSRRLPFGVVLVLALAAAALVTAGSSARAAGGLSIASDQPFAPGFSRTVVAGYAPGGARTFKLDFGGVFSYRANPGPRTVTAPALRSGMDARYPR